MGGKIDTRAIGLDTGLAMIRWITGAESLHYGDWTGLDVCAGNLRAAQDAYTDRVFALLPPAPCRILDIGGGAGETAKRLLAVGHGVEIVVPSAYLAARCRANAPAAQVHETTFEAFRGSGPFDVCLFSESFQYIPLTDSLPRVLSLLAPGGQVVIADCFRSDSYRGRDSHGPQPGGGHRLSAFRAALARLPVTVTHEEEITAAVAPSIDLEQAFFNVIGLGLTRAREELAAKRPLACWAVTRAAAALLSPASRARLAARLNGTARTAEAFRTFNHYMIYRLTPQPAQPLPQG
ncbi:MAG: methyltransferase domain-containing protein [Paracoccaceae bacterium]|nr:MAG: methyltransferase domain-containing protein [Paracoccaceae bacterium]